MPYPRIHITNVRGHGIPPCPLCVFPPGDACSPHGMHGIHRSFWRRIFSHGFHRCPQMVRLRKVLWLLWEDSLVGSPNLCVSVQSVGEYLAPETSVGICEICGRTSEGGVGMAGMPYPPNLCPSVKSVGEFCSVGAAGTAAPPVGQMQKVH